MMRIILALLSERSPISTMRLMSLFSLFVGAGIGVYGVYMGKDLGGIAQICGVFVVAAFTGKAAQKVVE